MKKVISVCRGDGIGPEIVEEAIKILKIIADYTELEFEFQEAPVGGGVYQETGTNMPEKSWDIIQNSDAILFGAVGLAPGVLPPGAAESAILKIRQELDLYVNLRPIKLYPALKDRCPLKDEFIGDGFVHNGNEYLYRLNGTVKNIIGGLLDRVYIGFRLYDKYDNFIHSKIYLIPRLEYNKTGEFKVNYVFDEPGFYTVEKVDFYFFVIVE